MAYHIKPRYTERAANEFFDDTPFKDEFQVDVYKHARGVAERIGARRIMDIGCGSGFKLVNQFPSPPFETMGVDLEPTVSWLKGAYPNRNWANNWLRWPAELVVCSDMVEHLPDPDLLLDYLAALAPKRIILSTPDRDLLGLGTEDGPPKNTCHVREWGKEELASYLGERFDILAHFIVGDATQIVEMEGLWRTSINLS